MFKKFYPSTDIDSVYKLDFEKLYEEGYRGVIFDVDNTLVTHGAKANTQAKELFRKLKHMGFSCCLLSNNKEERVKMFNKDVKVNYIFNAHKPSVKNYNKAMELMKTDKNTTLFIGDQLFTDIYGANRAGLYSVLVKPIHPKEEIQIVLKRYLEKIVLFFYEKTKK